MGPLLRMLIDLSQRDLFPLDRLFQSTQATATTTTAVVGRIATT